MKLDGSCHCGAVRFDEYPDESIAEWHRRLGLE